MGVPRFSVGVLLLFSALGAAFVPHLISASSHGSSGGSGASENSLETCSVGTQGNASHQISAALDTLASELLCRSLGDETLPEEQTAEAERNIRLIVESTLKVLFELVTNDSRPNVLDIFGVLDSLRLGDPGDPRFVKRWFSVKMAPLLPYVSQGFLVQLSAQNFTCGSFQELIEALSHQMEDFHTSKRRSVYTHLILGYMSREDLPDPGCVKSARGSTQWLTRNLGIFSIFASLEDLRRLNPNFLATEVLEEFSPQQKAELILDPDSSALDAGALDNEQLVREVFESFAVPPDVEQLRQFLRAFATIANEKNITFVEHPGVRKLILTLTLTALAPEFEDFQPQDFEELFQENLNPVIASLGPSSLVVIPRNISCASYQAIITGLRQSLRSLPLHLTHDVRSSIEELKDMFPNCPDPRSFKCHQTPVDEDLVCAAVNSSQSEEALSASSSSETLCSFNLTEHACSTGAHLTGGNLATLMNCSLESKRTYPVEVWKLLLQKAPAAVPQALDLFATMAPNTSHPSLSPPLEALGELSIDNFSEQQLENEAFVSDWFETKLRPFLASASPNFLFCLSGKNFSCQTYRTVIQAFSSQRAHMETERQASVFTHFIKPFLSRNDSSDSGCVSSTNDSVQWLQQNLGGFSVFATLQDLQGLNPNFSVPETLSLLSPKQLAQFILSSEALNDSSQLDLVFEQLREGDARENLDQFLAELTAHQRVPDFQPVVRDRAMNLTFAILRPHFTDFEREDWALLFPGRLSPVLPSFTPTMLTIATTDINCTNYHIIVRGLASIFHAMPPQVRPGITLAMLDYLRESASVINQPVCRQGIETDGEWLEKNLGPFSVDASYSDFRFFNLSSVSLLGSLSSQQQANLLLDSDNLSNTTFTRLLFEELTASSDVEELTSFFDTFVRESAKQNLTVLDPDVQAVILNQTLAALQPTLTTLEPEGYRLWFQENLRLCLPSVSSDTLESIPKSIPCQSYEEIVKGFDSVFEDLSVSQCQLVYRFTKDYLSQQSSGSPCVKSLNDDRLWLEDNFGQFRKHGSFADFVSLKDDFNGLEVAELLTPVQLGQLASTPTQLNTIQDVAKLMAVIDPDDYADFFDTVSPVIEVYPSNYTQEVKSAFLQEVLDSGFLSSSAVNDTDFLLWLRLRLRPLLVGLPPDQVAPLFDIGTQRSCKGRQEMITVLDSLRSTLSNETQAAIFSRTLLFLRDCPDPRFFKCHQTPVDEDLVCAAVNSSQSEEALSASSSSETLCSFNLTEHACSTGAHLTGGNLATLMNCSLESKRTYPVEVWKLLLQKAPAAVPQALDLFATMAPHTSHPSLSPPLEALGELSINNFSEQQLENEAFVSDWFETKLRPFLASASPNFLFCLSGKNFSCQTYRTVIQAFSSQRAHMETERQASVFTHFIKPFLSRNDSSDSGCVSSTNDSVQWLQQNLGGFSVFATLQDLQGLNPNFSIPETLSLLSLKQLAQFILSSEALNDSSQLDLVFEQLREGDARENLDQFLEELTAHQRVPDFQPVVRDRAMNLTFAILRPHFTDFEREDWALLFPGRLSPVLPSFTPTMLTIATTDINCTNYHIIVRGLASVFHAMPPQVRPGITVAMLDYLRESASVINQPVCRQGIETDGEWLEKNLGPFSVDASYSDFRFFNLSSVSLLGSLSSQQQANLLLDSDNLSNTTFTRLLFEELTASSDVEELTSFFDTFVRESAKQNLTVLDPDVQAVILNQTLAALQPTLTTLEPEGYRLWFQENLRLCLPSVSSDTLESIPKSIPCQSYEEIVKGFDSVFEDLSVSQCQLVYRFTKDYLSQQSSGSPCVKSLNDDRLWLEDNFGQFRKHGSFADFVSLKDDFNGLEVAELLTPVQLGQLASTPTQLNTIQDVAKLMAVIDPDDYADFFDTVSPVIEVYPSNYSQEVKSAFLQEVLDSGFLSSSAVNDTDFLLWLRLRLRPLLVGLPPDQVAPLFDIGTQRSCKGRQEMITVLDSLRSTLSNETQAAIFSRTLLFLRDCPDPRSFKCHQTPVDEDLVCAAVSSSQSEEALSASSSSETLCSFNLTEHACSTGAHLTGGNLATLMNCSLESKRTYPVEVWKLLLQKAPAAVPQALDLFATMAPNTSHPSLSTPLEALGELSIDNFSEQQLENEAFVSDWFETKLRPFLASASPNFLFCLSGKNFSCQTYRTVIQAFSSQRAHMETERQASVFTHFIKPFLSRNDSSDSGCVSSTNDSVQWLQQNLGGFSVFATLQDLQGLNPNFSVPETLSLLSPKQLAQFILSSEALNDSSQLDLVFEQLREGDARENLDQFLAELTAHQRVPDFQPVVRDRAMNLTFAILRPHFTDFEREDWALLFPGRLSPVLPSFTPTMLTIATTDINCTNYHIIVRGLASVFHAMPPQVRPGITLAMLDYLRESASVINQPVCRQGIETDGEWLEKNLGPFSVDASYSDFRFFNLSSVSLLGSLSSQQQANLLLDSDNLSNTTFTRLLFEELTASSDVEELTSFFDTFVRESAKQNLTVLDPDVQAVILNQTLAALQPTLTTLEPEGYRLWFQENLRLCLPSVSSDTLESIPKSIPCQSYEEIVKGFDSVFEDLSVSQCQLVYSFTKDYLSQQSSGSPCVKSLNDDRLWLEDNFGQFRKHGSFADFVSLKNDFNGLEVAELLTPVQLGQLASTPTQLNTIQDVAKIMAVIDPDDYADFFDTVSPVIEVYPSNYTQEVKSAFLQEVLDSGFLSSSAVNDTDFLLWLRLRLRPLLVGLPPDQVAPLFDLGTQRSCKGRQEMIAVLDSLRSTLSNETQVAIFSRTLLFLRDCPDPRSFKCHQTPVDEDLVCAAVNSSQSEEALSASSSSETLCSFNLTEHACSTGAHLTGGNLATLMNCSLESKRTYPVEVWKLLLQKAPAAVPQALDLFATMAPHTSHPSLSTPLEALGELSIDNFSEQQLENEAFVSDWFETKLRPFLASASPNFLFCLSGKNFSCQTYRTVIQAFSSQRAHMETERQASVFTHFIKPFLSRNDSSDSGCVSSTNDSVQWLQQNLGGFSVFATLQDLQGLNPNFSIPETLSLLSPKQLAQFILSSEALNDSSQLDLVFEQLREGDARENLDQFLAELTAHQRVPDFQPVVRDRAMNLTFAILRPHFTDFEREDWALLFPGRLSPVLPSFTPTMLTIATTDINCTNYHIIVRGLASVFHAMPPQVRPGITLAMLDYLRESASVINQPVCRQGIETDGEWLEKNLGPFSVDASYSDFRFFNLSLVSLLGSLSSQQQANLLLDSDNLSNTTFTRLLFEELTASSDVEELTSFFDTFVRESAKQNLTVLDPDVQAVILNQTLAALQPTLTTLEPEGYRLWFQENLRLCLPSVSSDTLESIPKSIPCQSYEEIVKGFDSVFEDLSVSQCQLVYSFTKDYLSQQSSGSPCVKSLNDDRLWLEDNFGQFRKHGSFADFVSLKDDFNGLEVAELLTPVQLGQLASTPTQLNTIQDVAKLMAVIDPDDYADFFDTVSPVIEVYPSNYTQEVKSAFLQEVLDSGFLSSSAVNDTDFLLWLRLRLRPLLVGLPPDQVAPLFDIGTQRSCKGRQEMITVLDSLRSTLSTETQAAIFSRTLLFLREPTPLRCYKGGSFYRYLRNTFLSFGFPDLDTFSSLLPQTRESELLSTFTTSELSHFLSRPDLIDDEADVCFIFDNYNNTAAFLETEDIPEEVAMAALPCVWPSALSSSSRSEADAWFGLRLRNYLRFVRKSLISPTAVQSASCFAFQELVAVLGGNFSYSTSDFEPADVYETIRTYLSDGSAAKCYNASDGELNSTAWFADNIGGFVTFVTVDDLAVFLSASQSEVFVVDETNLALFSNPGISGDVIEYYISELFLTDPAFDLMKLPGFFLCFPEVPVSAFASVNEAEALEVLSKLNTLCDGTQDPEVSAALASNIQTITPDVLVNLGPVSSGLTSSQISSAPPAALVSSLSILGSVENWSQEQAAAIIQTVTASGFLINNGSALQSLGSLVSGVPAELMQDIPAEELLIVSQNAAFISNMREAPSVLQTIFVQRIISLNDSSPDALLADVPDAMATEIPRSLLVFAGENVDINATNKKTWTHNQAEMFFEIFGETDFDIEQLSPSVLQGFTCTNVRRMTKRRIEKLVRACRRRRGRDRVVLRESQLTCMFNLLSGELTQNFTDYPPDMLLYFDAGNVDRANCRSYFSELGAADFSVASGILNKGSLLLGQARSCLGVSGGNLSREDVEVLGNMACTLSSSDIQSADPLVLENLKACKDLSESQAAAIETTLLSGTTRYGNSTTWNQDTLRDLGILPLYFSRNIWGRFTTSTKRSFLKTFMPSLRRSKTEKRKLKALFREVSQRRTARGAGCTVDNITQVTISDGSFPFGYDAQQFDLCLDVPVLKDNLNSICEKVDDGDLQKIILRKLNEAYPSGVPEAKVQSLGSVSRSASLDDVSRWKVTTVDTLAALMKEEDGSWEPELSKAIITKYLSTPSNSLGSIELKSIDSNLCSLDTSTLKTITPESIRNTATALDLSSCSLEKKKVLYEIANSSFSSHQDSATTYYNLIKLYIGGAPLTDVHALSGRNINMDIDAFRSLDPEVIAALSVSDVQGLLGNHLRDLKLFENDTVVSTWVNRQLQEELDTLGIGLVTTRPSETTLPPSSKPDVTTPAQTTSGGAALAKHQTSLFPAALLTTLLLLRHLLG